jgi:hypothetical protein
MRADHRTMPKGPAPRAGEVPSPVTLIADSYALQLAAERTNKPHAKPGYRYRFSAAAACARKNGYEAMGVEPDEQPDHVSLHIMDAGTRGHDVVQQSFLRRYWEPEVVFDGGHDVYVPQVDAHTHWGLMGICEFEVPCSIEGVGTGHADIWCPKGIPGTEYDGRPLVVELKHTNGFAYKQQVGERGAAQGPRHSAKVQGALCAEALGAEVVCIATVSTEAISKGLAESKGIPLGHRAFAEWWYEIDEWHPLALAEMARVTRMLAIIDEGGLPPRQIYDPASIPVKARVVNPEKGAWTVEAGGSTVEAGTYWACGYCDHRPRCIADGPS